MLLLFGQLSALRNPFKRKKTGVGQVMGESTLAVCYTHCCFDIPAISYRLCLLTASAVPHLVFSLLVACVCSWGGNQHTVLDCIQSHLIDCD